MYGIIFYILIILAIKRLMLSESIKKYISKDIINSFISESTFYGSGEIGYLILFSLITIINSYFK